MWLHKMLCSVDRYEIIWSKIQGFSLHKSMFELLNDISNMNKNEFPVVANNLSYF